MIEKNGDLFTSDAPGLGHGVNCAGVMGAGVARTFKYKFPNNFNNYAAACHKGMLKPGSLLTCSEKGVTIFNMASQNKPGRDARYAAVFESALKAAEVAVQMEFDRIAIPEIGSHIGGLEWSKVREVLKTVEWIINGHPAQNTPKFEWEVWHYDG